MGDEYWLVSVPGNPSREAALNRLSGIAGPGTGLTTSFTAFTVPLDLKVGTLDHLMGLSDDLVRLDPMVESVVRKIASLLQGLLQDYAEKIPESLRVEGVDAHDYIRQFQWDVRKYSIKNSTREIVDGIVKKVVDAEQDVKNKHAAYTAVKGSLVAVQRSETGSLLSRSLVGVVERRHVVADSEYLQTVMVCVPRLLSKDWQASYEQLTDMVVPRSAILVTSDQDYELWSVTMLKRVVDEFKHVARERKCMVRDFTFDPTASEHSAVEKRNMEKELKKQWGIVVRWSKTFFSETFVSWMHLKAVRVFVESVLRYGLPPNFMAAAMCPSPRKDKALRRAMQNAYQLDKREGIQDDEQRGDIEMPAGMSAGLTEYYPYVSFSFSLAFLTAPKK